MPKLNYNLDEMPDSIGVPAGRYRAKLKSCKKKLSKSSNQPMLEWEWLILTGEYKGQTIRSWTSLQEQALAGLKQHLAALGVKKKIKGSSDLLIGKIVVLVVGMRASTQEGREGQEFSSVMDVLTKDAPLRAPKKKQDVADEEPSEDEDEEEGEEEEEEDEEEEDEEEEEEEEEEEDWEDEDEEDEKPAKTRAKPAAKKQLKKSRSK